MTLKEAGLGGHFPARVAGVDGVPGLDEQHLGLFFGVRAVLDAPRGTDEISPGSSSTSRSRRSDRQASAEDQNEVVGLVVLVPYEGTLDLDHLQFVVVDEADDARLVWLVKQGELGSKVDLLVHDGEV